MWPQTVLHRRISFLEDCLDIEIFKPFPFANVQYNGKCVIFELLVNGWEKVGNRTVGGAGVALCFTEDLKRGLGRSPSKTATCNQGKPLS